MRRCAFPDWWCWLVVAMVGAAALPLPLHAQYFRYGKNKVQYEAHDWYYVQSRHFNVYYYRDGRPLAEFTARAAEAAYEQVRSLFQHEIADRIPLIVYQSHNDFAVTNVANLPAYSEGIGGVTELFKNRIALPFTGDYRDFRRVIHHELVHAVINDMFYGGSIQSILQNNVQLRIPDWFNEGLAEYAALGWDTQSDMYVREAVLEDDLAPIPYLSGYFAYRGGQGVWDYVAEQYGQQKVSEILQRLKLGRSVEGAFQRAVGLSLEELSERWHKALKEIHYPEMAARENIGTIARPLITRDEGFYNTSPALSPQGDKLAYITTRSGLFDVYVASANDGQERRRLIAGQTSPTFESLRILTPGLSWSPDGRRLAVAVKSKASDAIALVEVATGKSVLYRVPGIDQVLSLSWSPDGRRLAFSASMNAQSDLFVLDLETKETLNLTNDVFSDLEPAWSPDGAALVFHSDRGPYTALGRHAPDAFPMLEHDYGQFDVYRLVPGAAEAERLTADGLWDERSPRFGADPNRLYFLSDRNGITNLYEKDLATGRERPLTDLAVGLTQFSLSADGAKAAVVSLHEGTPSIFLLVDPAARQLPREVLLPTVWAQRGAPGGPLAAPALALAQAGNVQGNPFLRDAADGVAYARTLDRGAPLPRAGEDGSALAALLQAPAATNGHDAPLPENAASDTTSYGGVRVDFRNYVFTDAFDEAAGADGEPPLDPFAVADNVDEDGRYKPKKYRLDFSPDLVYGTAGYDVLYGMQGVTQMMFSDMLGNHQIFVATNLLIDLRNSDYVLSYNYLPRRVDWSLSGFHLSRVLLDTDLVTAYRYRWYGASVAGSYPLDKFRRVDLDVALTGVSQADVVDAAEPAVTRALVAPTLTYTVDATVPGFMAPAGGTRYALRVTGSPAGLQGGRVQFVTLLADARAYTSAVRGFYSLAVRGSAGFSFGPTQQLFYASGVQNWINRRFDDENGFPVSSATDFIFATPVLPLRGYDVNARNGSNFALVNAEFRFPLVAALLPGPIPLLPLYNLQGSAFVDAGALWGGRGLDNRLRIFGEDAAGRRVFDDPLVGAGLGLRTLLLGYPIRLDWAWPFDGQRFGARKLYLSIGLDF